MLVFMNLVDQLQILFEIVATPWLQYGRLRFQGCRIEQAVNYEY